MRSREYYLNKYLLGDMSLGEWWDMAQEICPAIASAVNKSNFIRCFIKDEYEREVACLGVRLGTMRFLYAIDGKAFVITAGINQRVKLDADSVIMENIQGKTMAISFPDMPKLI
jgi:hypothetical protein